jgi:zinc protease
MRDALTNQAASPDAAFAQELSQALSQGHPRTRPLTPDATARMDMDASLQFFKDRFGDASDFTFVFVGSFEVEAIRPLVERYLASLPALRRAESWIDPGVRPPQGVVRRTVERGAEPRSRTAIVFTGLADPDRAKAVTVVALAEILEGRLRNRLREELGGTYAVNVGGSLARVPVGQYTISVDFTSDPARAADLAVQVLNEVARFRDSGPTPREVQDVRAVLLRDIETNSRQNQYLAGQLAQRYQSGEPPESLWQMPAIYGELSVARLHDAARAHLDPASYVQVVLMPQQK